ncbi:MAG: hypothetical protein AABW50_04205 [Nanoarchaeota archaeon]
MENKKSIKSKRLFMKPGKTNKEDRINFVKFWVKNMKQMSDKEWSRQQNMLIDSVIKINKGKQNVLIDSQIRD